MREGMKVVLSILLGGVFCCLDLSAAYEVVGLVDGSPVRSEVGITLTWKVRYQSDTRPVSYKEDTKGTFFVSRNGVLIATVVDKGGYIDYDTVAGGTYSYTVTLSPGNSSFSRKSTCYGSYKMMIGCDAYTLSPDVNWVLLGTAEFYNYDEVTEKITSSPVVPSIKADNCDWITKVVGESAWKVLSNASGLTRVAAITLSVGYPWYDQVVTVTQLPDKMAANGKDTYWDCHVAGIDPSDPNGAFKVLISMTNDVPSIGWSPALNGDRVKKGARIYSVSGTKSLGDDAHWETVEDGQESSYNFFRVSVAMP